MKKEEKRSKKRAERVHHVSRVFAWAALIVAFFFFLTIAKASVQISKGVNDLFLALMIFCMFFSGFLATVSGILKFYHLKAFQPKKLKKRYTPLMWLVWTPVLLFSLTGTVFTFLFLIDLSFGA